MPKWSAVQTAVNKIDEEIADLQRVRERLIAAMNPEPQRTRQRKPKAAESLPLKSKRRDRGEGATTDSGNMDYPPA